MKEHIDRLYRSLKNVSIDSGMSPGEMLDINEEAIRRNEDRREEVGDFTIHPFVTRGLEHSGRANVCVRVAPVGFSSFAHLYNEGAHGVITRTRSYSPESVDPKVKHYSRMNFNLAALEARDVDPEAYPILTDSDGNVTEGVGNNVLLVTDGVIRSPDDRSILQGISRGMVMDLAQRLNIPFVEEDLQPYDLYNADEVFFTGTSPCVLPCTEVDRRQVSDGKPGPITQQLLAAWSEGVGVDIVDQALRYAKR